MRKSLILAGCTAMALTLAACGEDERVAELENQVNTYRTEAEGLRGELEQARARVTELEGAAAAPGADPETLREPLTTALSALRETDTQLVQLEQALTAEGMTNVSLTELRTNLGEASQAIGEVASAAGVDPEALAPATAGTAN